MKPDEAAIFLQARLDGGYYLKIPHGGLTEDGEAVRALLEGFEAMATTIRNICDYCGYEAGSKECKNAWCAIRKWRGPEPGGEG